MRGVKVGAKHCDAEEVQENIVQGLPLDYMILPMNLICRKEGGPLLHDGFTPAPHSSHVAIMQTLTSPNGVGGGG